MARIDYFKTHNEFTEYTAGQIIFDVGQPGDLMYAVKEGEVDIVYNNQVLETVPAGHFFGEMALIDGHQRSAMAVAKTNCKLVKVDKKHFLFLVQETPTFAIQVMQVLSDRLRHMNSMMPQTAQ